MLSPPNGKTLEYLQTVLLKLEISGRYVYFRIHQLPTALEYLFAFFLHHLLVNGCGFYAAQDIDKAICRKPVGYGGFSCVQNVHLEAYFLRSLLNYEEFA